MSTSTTPRPPQLTLTLAADRSLIWTAGDSVRYLVADINVDGELPPTNEQVPLNLALAIDVSGSMQGEKLESAKRTALAVANGMRDIDRLTIVSFSDDAILHLSARQMDSAGRAEARDAIRRLRTISSTNLFGGWQLAGETLVEAMRGADRASHRIILLTDGQANVGVSDAPSLAMHTATLQQRGVITSAVGIGDDYDQEILAAMTEAGGGRLHDAENAGEINEVVLGELLEGRRALVERVTLTIKLGRGLRRCELLGSWAMTPGPDEIQVMVGSLRPESPKRVVLRVTCDAGAAGSLIPFNASVTAQRADGAGEISAVAPEMYLRFVEDVENNAQVRDRERSLAALLVWQSTALTEAITMNRAGHREQAKHKLGQELRWMRRYAEGLQRAEGLITEAEVLYHDIGYDLEERSRKDVAMMLMQRSRSEEDLRSKPRRAMRDTLKPRRP